MIYKVLGNGKPAASTEHSIYEVDTDKRALSSTFTACNQGSTDAKIRLSVTVGGGTTGGADYLLYDLPLPANDTFAMTIGMTLGPLDVVRVYSDSADVSYLLFGQEQE